MIRPTAPPPPEDDPDETVQATSLEGAGQHGSGFQPFGPGGPDLSALPIAGITQRRMAILLGIMLAAWIVLLFARQVGDASAASSRAEAMVVDNSIRRAEVAGLERELDRIQQRRFIWQQASGVRFPSVCSQPASTVLPGKWVPAPTWLLPG